MSPSVICFYKIIVNCEKCSSWPLLILHFIFSPLRSSNWSTDTLRTCPKKWSFLLSFLLYLFFPFVCLCSITVFYFNTFLIFVEILVFYSISLVKHWLRFVVFKHALANLDFTNWLILLQTNLGRDGQGDWYWTLEVSCRKKVHFLFQDWMIRNKSSTASPNRAAYFSWISAIIPGEIWFRKLHCLLFRAWHLLYKCVSGFEFKENPMTQL